MKVENVSTDIATAILRRGHLAHLACASENQPYLVPLAYAYDAGSIYVFSMPGQKVDWMRGNPKVSVLVEEHEPGRMWQSVLVEGTYEELTDTPQHKLALDRAWMLLARHASWWEPGGLRPGPQTIADHSPHLFFRINVGSITGRRCVE